jgi:hypothetical protein
MRVSPKWPYNEMRIFQAHDTNAAVIETISEEDYPGATFLVDESESTSNWWRVQLNNADGCITGWVPKRYGAKKATKISLRRNGHPTLEHLDLGETMQVDEARGAGRDTESEKKFYKDLDKFHNKTDHYTSCINGDPRKGLALPARGPRKQRLDLFGMYNAVKLAGGYDTVTSRKGAWGKIADATDNQWGKKRKGSEAKSRYKLHLREFELAQSEIMVDDGDDDDAVINRYDDEEEQPEELGKSAFDNVKTLQEKLEVETGNILGEIREFKLNVVKDLKVCDTITRPLENNVENIRRRPWPGSRTVVLGENGIGKSFLLDLVLRLGNATEAEYERRNKDAIDEPLEAVRDEALEREQASTSSSSPNKDFDVLIREVEKKCVQPPPEGVFQKKGDSGAQWHVLKDQEKRRKALEADEQVQKFCRTEERDSAKGFESFMLPSRNAGKSTTGNSIIIKNGSSWSLTCRYYTKDEITEKLNGFDWAGNRDQQEQGNLDETETKLFDYMKDWKQKIENPVKEEEDRRKSAAVQYPSTDSDDDSGDDDDDGDDSDSETEKMIEAVVAKQNQDTGGKTQVHADYEQVLGKTVIYSGPPGTKERDARIYIKEILEKVLFGGREHVLRECVLYAPCMLIHEGSCLVDTAGTDDSDAMKHHLLVEELTHADTVLCVVNKGLPESESTIKWLQRERLIERALGGAALVAEPEGKDEEGASTGASTGSRRWMTASEKPLKLVFLVNHQERHSPKTARQIAERDDDYDGNSTTTKAQATAIRCTKTKIYELIGMADRTLSPADISSLSKGITYFSCNPLLYVSLLTNKSIKSKPELCMVYQKALARSNGKDLLTALSKCAAKNDVSDRVRAHSTTSILCSINLKLMYGPSFLYFTINMYHTGEGARNVPGMRRHAGKDQRADVPSRPTVGDIEV